MSVASIAKQEKAERIEQATTRLLAAFPKGSTASTMLLHVSASGMSRVVAVVGIEDGEAVNLSYPIGRVIDRKLDRDRCGVRCSGAGMDMGFDLVYSLSMSLYGDGYAIRHRWL